MSKFIPIQKGLIFQTGSYNNIVTELKEKSFKYMYIANNCIKEKEMTFFYWGNMAKMVNHKPHIPLYRNGKRYL